MSSPIDFCEKETCKGCRHRHECNQYRDDEEDMEEDLDAEDTR